ncbi:MAG: SDR family oxidoreductase [Victivallales bacterium]|nr:SDR family oxidoreductase [Victivallales bacterium]
MNITGKKVIVTGGSGGYGKGIAEAFKKAGANVWITGRNEQKLKDTANELGVHAVLADVSSGKDWDNLMVQVGDVDVLINNAGGGGAILPVAEQNDADIINVINNNLTGTILGCSRAAKIMQQKKSGLIVNISSVCALYAWPAWSVYTAAKAGLSKFSHGLYTELRPYGVRVFCVTPSWGDTGFNTAANIAAFTPETRSQCIHANEMGKLILDLAELPDHLNITDITIQPLIQEINPM